MPGDKTVLEKERKRFKLHGLTQRRIHGFPSPIGGFTKADNSTPKNEVSEASIDPGSSCQPWTPFRLQGAYSLYRVLKTHALVKEYLTNTKSDMQSMLSH